MHAQVKDKPSARRRVGRLVALVVLVVGTTVAIPAHSAFATSSPACTMTTDSFLVFGTSGNDVICLSGNVLGQTVYADDGDDIIRPTPTSTASIDGQGGTDTIDFGQATGSVSFNLGAAEGSPVAFGDGTVQVSSIENVTGSSFSDDVLIGDGGNNVIDGGGGGDQLDGGDGNDTLHGTVGTNDDQLSGGDGTDTVDYSDSPVGVTVDLAHVGQQNTGQGHDTLDSIENVTGSAHDDHLTGNPSGNALDRKSVV